MPSLKPEDGQKQPASSTQSIAFFLLNMSEFNASFSLFASKEKLSEKSPDHTGTIEVLADEVQAMISYLQTAEREDDWQGNSVVKIRLASWNNISPKGLAYQKGKVSKPMPKSDTATQRSAPAPVAAGSDLPF